MRTMPRQTNGPSGDAEPECGAVWRRVVSELDGLHVAISAASDLYRWSGGRRDSQKVEESCCEDDDEVRRAALRREDERVEDGPVEIVKKIASLSHQSSSEPKRGKELTARIRPW